MAQENIAFSQSIANLDNLPSVNGVTTLTYATLAAAVQGNFPLQNTSGEGAAGLLKQVNDSVIIASGDNTSSTYSFVRIPTNAHVKSVVYYATSVATAGAADFNVRFSDSITDGTPTALQGTVPQISAANNQLFGAGQSLLATSTGLVLTYANTTNYPLGSENKPLWSVLGFTTDPGGMFDIVAYVTTTVTTGGVGMLKVDYVMPGS